MLKNCTKNIDLPRENLESYSEKPVFKFTHQGGFLVNLWNDFSLDGCSYDSMTIDRKQDTLTNASCTILIATSVGVVDSLCFGLASTELDNASVFSHSV